MPCRNKAQKSNSQCSCCTEGSHVHESAGCISNLNSAPYEYALWKMFIIW